MESRQHALGDRLGPEGDRPAAGRRPRLQDELRQGEPHLRQDGPRHGAEGGPAGLRRDPRIARPAHPHRRSRRAPVRARGRGGGRDPDSRLPLPPDRPPDRRRPHGPRDQCEEGPVPRPLGHEERGRQDHRGRQSQRDGLRARRLLRLQHPRQRHAGPAGDWPRSAARWCSTPPTACSSRAGRGR